MITIEDNRTLKEFTKCSFSGFKKVDVLKELIKAMDNKNVEPVLYWTGELLCAGHILELWNAFIIFACVHINVCNPKIPIYIMTRYEEFKKRIIHYTDNELEVRNDAQVRILFAEMAFLLMHSNKTHPIVPIKINVEELNLTTISHKLLAPDTSYIKNYDKADPVTLCIPINELKYHLSVTKSMHNITYWIEWIITYDDMCTKHKDKLQCKTRFEDYIKENNRHECIWLIWELMKDASSTLSPLHQEIMFSLFQLFCIRYTKGQRRKRIPILYMAVMIICMDIDPKIKLFKKTMKLESIVEKIYKQINNNRIIQ